MRGAGARAVARGAAGGTAAGTLLPRCLHLPVRVGEIAFQNKAIVYAILFGAAAETLATIAADRRHLGAKLGITMVLHTWGETLQHHRHMHCVVRGGGPRSTARWVAWARRGKRCVAKVRHGRWNTTTFLAALGLDRIDARWLLEGRIDGESFRTYVARVLVRTLREGDIVVMDNLGSHKGKALRELISSTARSFSSCANISETSIASNRSSRSTSTCCEKRTRGQAKPSVRQSAKFFAPSRRKNARTTSRTLAMHERKIITL